MARVKETQKSSENISSLCNVMTLQRARLALCSASMIILLIFIRISFFSVDGVLGPATRVTVNGQSHVALEFDMLRAAVM